ncbi:CotS-related protein [Bacillus sp. JCM 19046]|nr:CotS-related protein [Bacillus sp. JCM 19045]GAF16056.1 CotS-related protein [Bacillus sp. JCM 19046]
MNRFVEALMYYYDLQPTAAEKQGKLFRVETDRGVFALKESAMDRVRADEFVHAMRKLAKLQFKQFVPIIPTKFGEYTLFVGEKSYYLMPWIEPSHYSSRTSIEEVLSDYMGIIHRLTVKTQPASKEKLDESCERLLSRWEMHSLELSRFADQAELSTYLSPFELTFLTHYRMYEQLANQATEYLESWYKETLEKGSYRSVLSHGQLSRKHALTTEKEVFITNFEQASLDTPARDIASFCRRSFPYTLWNEDEVLRWFARYEQHLPLLKTERYLISAYLVFPEPIYYAVMDYRNGGSEFEHVQKLEKRIIAMRKVQRLIAKIAPQEETASNQ